MRQTEYCQSCYATMSDLKSLQNSFPEYAYLVKAINATDFERTWNSHLSISNNAYKGEYVFYPEETRDLSRKGCRYVC